MKLFLALLLLYSVILKCKDQIEKLAIALALPRSCFPGHWRPRAAANTVAGIFTMISASAMPHWWCRQHQHQCCQCLLLFSSHRHYGAAVLLLGTCSFMIQPWHPTTLIMWDNEIWIMSHFRGTHYALNPFFLLCLVFASNPSIKLTLLDLCLPLGWIFIFQGGFLILHVNTHSRLLPTSPSKYAWTRVSLIGGKA